MTNNSINGFLKSDETVSGARIVFADGTTTAPDGTTKLAIKQGAADVSVATGVRPIGVVEGNPTTSQDGGAVGGGQPVKVVIEGIVKVKAGQAFDPTNADHIWVTSNADGEAIADANDGTNFLLGRNVSNQAVAENGLLLVAIQIVG